MAEPYTKWLDEAQEQMLNVIAYLISIDPPKESPEGKLLIALVEYQEVYEQKHFPI